MFQATTMSTGHASAMPEKDLSQWKHAWNNRISTAATTMRPMTVPPSVENPTAVVRAVSTPVTTNAATMRMMPKITGCLEENEFIEGS